jgi:hypothetical protein
VGCLGMQWARTGPDVSPPAPSLASASPPDVSLASASPPDVRRGYASPQRLGNKRGLCPPSGLWPTPLGLSPNQRPSRKCGLRRRRGIASPHIRRRSRIEAAAKQAAEPNRGRSQAGGGAEWRPQQQPAEPNRGRSQATGGARIRGSTETSGGAGTTVEGILPADQTCI